jgi:SAM-dependent methyltransferase
LLLHFGAGVSTLKNTMNSITDPHAWEQRYQNQNTPWDLQQAAPPLVDWYNQTQPTPGLSAVLGCGKGYDAVWLAQQGFEVVGFDFAPAAIAQAQNLAAIAQVSVDWQQRDIFQLEEYAQKFDYVIEHTCFCAIAPEQRPEYVQVVGQLLKPKGKLVAIFFTHQRPGGPPYGTTKAEIESLFAQKFKIMQFKPITNSIARRKGEEHLAILEIKT